MCTDWNQAPIAMAALIGPRSKPVTMIRTLSSPCLVNTGGVDPRSVGIPIFPDAPIMCLQPRSGAERGAAQRVLLTLIRSGDRYVLSKYSLGWSQSCFDSVAHSD